MVIWITGRANSGKTTLAKALATATNTLLIDGDEFRAVFPAGYTDEERHAHIMRMAKVAAWVESQGLVVVVACVSPKKAWRMEARKLFKRSVLIYLPGGELWLGTEYEEPAPEEYR